MGRVSAALLWAALLSTPGAAAEARTGGTGPQAPVAPNFSDNTWEPLYLPDDAVTLTAAEIRLAQAHGLVPSPKEYLESNKECSAVFQVVYGVAGGWRCHMIRACFFDDRVTMEDAHYDLNDMPRSKAYAWRQRFREGDFDGFGTVSRLWQASWGRSERDRLAQELNTIDVFYLKSCKPAPVPLGLGTWPSRRIFIEGEYRRPTASGGANGSYKGFYAIRLLDGQIAESSFRVVAADGLADTRYERALYVFGACEPLRVFLEALREGAWEDRIERPGQDAPPPAATEKEWREGDGAPRSWPFVAVGLGGLPVGLILGFSVGTVRRQKASVDDTE
jgi:hypothetical protein